MIIGKVDFFQKDFILYSIWKRNRKVVSSEVEKFQASQIEQPPRKSRIEIGIGQIKCGKRCKVEMRKRGEDMIWNNALI